jgi:CheY-like chemotaxis protein
MQTQSATLPTTAARPGVRAAQKIVLVNGSPELLALLEPALEAGRYDISFVASREGAYAHVKRVQPNVVILCVRFEDPEAYQVLSMLKLDPETREIPVVTFVAELGGRRADGETDEASGGERFSPESAVVMN